MADALRLDIDQLQLETEWGDQPKLFHTWAVVAADSQLALDRAKANFELVEAEQAKAIRDDPASYDLPKITEAGLASTVILQPEYQGAQRVVHEARHELELANAAVTALEHRKRALSLLVELWIRDYYSEPTTRPTTPEGEEFTKKVARERGRKRRDREIDADD